MDGLLVVDKPSGPTSHDVVARIRRATGERRVGHTGTLDPLASGVLPVVIGRATRLARFLSASDKSYDAVLGLGFATDTFDRTGAPLGARYRGPMPSRAAVEEALDGFKGTFLQQPPRYSAKKIDGRRSYRLARAQNRNGAEEPSRAPAPVSVTIYTLDLVEYDDLSMRLHVRCSAGFYVRTLAYDLGERLGVGAHLAALCRTRSGDATLADAVPLDALERDPGAWIRALVPLGRMLPALSAVVLTAEGVRHAANGRELGPADTDQGLGGLFPRPGLTQVPDPYCRLLDRAGDLVGLASPSATPGLLHPSVILV